MDIRNLSDRIGSLSERFGSTDDLLNALGLEQRRTISQSMGSASGWFGAGILIGAGLALLLVARSEEVRGAIGGTGNASNEGSRPLTQM